MAVASSPCGCGDAFTRVWYFWWVISDSWEFGFHLAGAAGLAGAADALGVAAADEAGLAVPAGSAVLIACCHWLANSCVFGPATAVSLLIASIRASFCALERLGSVATLCTFS